MKKVNVVVILLIVVFLIVYIVFHICDYSKYTISIKEMGAKCNGIDDDWEAINKTFEYARKNKIKEIDMGNGTCNISKPLHLYCNNITTDKRINGKIKLTGNATFKHKNIDFIIIEKECNEVTIKGIKSISLYSPYNRDINNDNIIDENDSIRHIRNDFQNHELKLIVNNVSFVGGVTGLFGNDLKKLIINNSTFYDMHFIPEYGRGGYGVLLQSCQNVTINNSKFIAGKYYRHGIYVSVNNSNYNENKNIKINNCLFDYSKIEPVDFNELLYPKDKIYDGISKSHIWSPSTAPIMVRKTNGITISNSVFLNTVTTSIFTGENGKIKNIYLKNLEINPTYREGEYNYGTYFSGRIVKNKINTVSGIINNLKVNDKFKNYKYAAFSYANVKFVNCKKKLPINNITPFHNTLIGV